MGRMNGWKKDLPDERDYQYKELRPQSRLFKAIMRPRAKYLKADNLPVVVNQGQIGSCVGHGVAELCSYVLDYLYASRDGKSPDMLSRLFAYYNARDNKNKDEGAYIRNGIKGVVQYGICDEVDWPYVESKWAERPSDYAFAKGRLRANNIEYFRINTIGDAIDCIAQGFPVVFGTLVWDEFNYVGPSGMVPMPDEKENAAGGHCMLVVGYSMTKKAFYVRNSWGPHWGDHGNCWLSFDYMQKYASDFWTIRRLSR